jgi:pimeloyl-ACP methyl ester carboxylesterase
MNTQSAVLTTPDATGSEPALKYVQANGLRFAYLEQGSGPLVMFMHGFPDNAWSYRKQLQAFADAGSGISIVNGRGAVPSHSALRVACRPNPCQRHMPVRRRPAPR